MSKGSVLDHDYVLEFYLKNLGKTSRYLLLQLLDRGYVVSYKGSTRRGGGRGRLPTLFALSDKGRSFIGLPEVESINQPKATSEFKSNVHLEAGPLKFCFRCGMGHKRKYKRYCSDECLEQEKKEKEQKRLDYQREMDEIRVKEAKEKQSRKLSNAKYYVGNREKILDKQQDYYHSKKQDQILLTILTTTI